MRPAKSVRLATLALVVALAGCVGGPTVKINATDKAAIKSVTMNAPPALPAEMFFHGPAQSAGAMFGIVGALIAQNAAKKPTQQLLDTMTANGIDLPSILSNEFFGEAKSRGLLSRVDSSALAQGDLTLTVNMYGFNQSQGFSSLLYPLLNVTATIKKPSGEIAWQRTDSAGPLNSDNKYGYEFDQYMKEPELLRKNMANISGIVSKMLLDHLATSE